MAGIRDIKKRIDAVQSTAQITRTMEMIASAKIRRATERAVASTPYAKAINRMLAHLSRSSADSSHPLLEKRDESGAILLVAVVSDRGLAGAFNSSVLRYCDKIIKKRRAEGKEVHLIACGKKAIAYFAYRNYKMIREFRDLSADPTLDQAREIASISAEMFIQKDIDSLHVIYNHARNAADQDLVDEKILPIDPAELLYVYSVDKYGEISTDDDLSDMPLLGEFEFEPDENSVLESLLPGYLETDIFHSLLDSAAAEQGARRKAMKAATDNATEMIETLGRIYNRARQGAITTEITEIVGGAAAAED